MLRFRNGLTLSLCLAMVLALLSGCATSQVAKAPETPDWFFHDIVDAAFVQQYAVMPQLEGVMIVDSRPYKPKYALGHIPMAVNIPDSQFEKMTDMLPEDKNALLVFYCGGPT